MNLIPKVLLGTFLIYGSFYKTSTFAAEPLRVAAAASLADSLKEIHENFTKATNVKVELNLGASSALARQIEAGAPTDVFISADLAKMKDLAGKGLVQSDTQEDQLSNSLVIVTSSDSTLNITSTKDLTGSNVSKIVTGDPKAVPVGVYAKEYLEKAGLWESLQSKVIAAENVRAALAAVESGNVEVGIVYKTDAAISRKVKIAYEIPQAEGPKITYPMAALKDSAQLDVAKKYLDFLDLPESKAIFEKFGFVVLPEAESGK